MLGFDIENQYPEYVAGVDEVGRGPLAGPVVAACVIIPQSARAHKFINDIKDSKKLSDKKREKIYKLIKASCYTAIAAIEPSEIDKTNILNASLKAMSQAIAKTSKKISHALIDGNRLPVSLPCPATSIIKGDSKCISIAAASIIAKVHRDRLMKELARQYPSYGWEQNMGYPTKQHREALQIYGPSPHHRRSFAPVREAILNRAAS